jgi:hypothetical protein
MRCLQLGPLRLSLFEIVLIASVLFILGCILWFSNSKRRHKFRSLANDAIDEYNRLFRRKKKGRKHEEECRRVLEQVFKAPFPSVRPDWLKSPWSGRNLELDCYNSRINLAVERDGVQHAKYTPHFHRKGPHQFEAQKKRDRWKDKRCKELGLTLIRVPHTVKFKSIEPFLRKQLRKNGYA